MGPGRPRTRHLKTPQFCQEPVEGEPCGDPVKHQPLGLCNRHYARYRRHGCASGGHPMKRRPPLQIPHGTIRGYTDFLCGCQPCTDANREACYKATRARLEKAH